MIDWVKTYWSRIWVLLVVFALAGAVWAGFHFIREVDHTANEAKAASAKVAALSLRNHLLVNELDDALKESCNDNGNSRAEVVQEIIEEEIHEAEHPDPKAFHALVEVGVPPKTIRELEAKSVGKLNKRLDNVHLTNCNQQYHLGSAK